ncbi:hypothetical protein EON77_12710 [bacterium]|nr:MAG: hypothetical protein EON77_12710 [bacterium]
MRLKIDARASWSPEDEFVVLYKSYGYGAGHLSLLDPQTGGARRVSDDADFVWWAGPRQAILVGTPLRADDPLVRGVFVRQAMPEAVYGVPTDLGRASRGKIVTPEGTLYSSQGRYGAYCPMSEVASIPGFEGARDEVWTKARGSRQYPPALPADSNRVVSVWTSPNRLLTAVTGTSSPTVAIQGLEAGVARYRVIGLGRGESIVGFVHN